MMFYKEMIADDWVLSQVMLTACRWSAVSWQLSYRGDRKWHKFVALKFDVSFWYRKLASWRRSSGIQTCQLGDKRGVDEDIMDMLNVKMMVIGLRIHTVLQCMLI